MPPAGHNQSRAGSDVQQKAEVPVPPNPEFLSSPVSSHDASNTQSYEGVH